MPSKLECSRLQSYCYGEVRWACASLTHEACTAIVAPLRWSMIAIHVAMFMQKSKIAPVHSFYNYLSKTYVIFFNIEPHGLNRPVTLKCVLILQIYVFWKSSFHSFLNDIHMKMTSLSCSHLWRNVMFSICLCDIINFSLAFLTPA